MTRDEIIKIGTFTVSDTVSELELVLFIPFFNRQVRVQALNLTATSSENEYDLTTQIINEILSYPAENKNWLKKEIYNHFLAYISNMEYGARTIHPNDNLENGNEAFFKIYNEDDAYNNVEPNLIWFDVTYTGFRYFNVEYKCPWENEHGIKIGIMNGEFYSIQ